MATTPTRKKAQAPAAARKPAARNPETGNGTFEESLAALGRKADEARGRLAEMTDEGARVASRSLQKASRATRAKLRELERKWKQLEPKKKATVLAGVLGAIAAAVAVPLAVRQRRKTRQRKAAPES
jgi:hypothetical protein